MTIPSPIECCPIWGKGYSAEVSTVPGTMNSSVKSDRAGGAYEIGGPVAVNRLLEGKDEAWKARLTTWLIDQREQGVRAPKIKGEIVDLIDRQPRLPPTFR